MSADEVLVTLRMRRATEAATGRPIYVSAVNEYSCLSIDAALPEVVSVVCAPLPLGQPARPIGEPSGLSLGQTLGLREGDTADTQLRGDLDAIRKAEAAALASIDAPWWLVREAVASTALDRDETVGTYSLPEEKP